MLVTAWHGARGSAGALLAQHSANTVVTGVNGTGRMMPQSHPLSQRTARAKPTELLTDMPKTRELALSVLCLHQARFRLALSCRNTWACEGF